jgi:hypothetical protein
VDSCLRRNDEFSFRKFYGAGMTIKTKIMGKPPNAGDSDHIDFQEFASTKHNITSDV